MLKKRGFSGFKNMIFLLSLKILLIIVDIGASTYFQISNIIHHFHPKDVR